MPTSLVTGGAGFIGSHLCERLLGDGWEVYALDDLSTGFADVVPPGATFVKGTLRDGAAEVLSDGIDAVLHFAAKSLLAFKLLRVDFADRPPLLADTSALAHPRPDSAATRAPASDSSSGRKSKP